MKGKFLINSNRIDGIQLLEMKFPSLTKRQICQLYEIATSQKLSLEDIKHVNMSNPSADIGERFGITIEQNL